MKLKTGWSENVRQGWFRDNSSPSDITSIASHYAAAIAYRKDIQFLPDRREPENFSSNRRYNGEYSKVHSLSVKALIGLDIAFPLLDEWRKHEPFQQCFPAYTAVDEIMNIHPWLHLPLERRKPTTLNSFCKRIVASF